MKNSIGFPSPLLAAKLLDQTLVSFECRFGRVVIAHNAELVKRDVVGAIGVAKVEQLVMRDVQFSSQAVDGADDRIERRCLPVIRTIRSRRPAVLGNSDWD